MMLNILTKLSHLISSSLTPPNKREPVQLIWLDLFEGNEPETMTAHGVDSRGNFIKEIVTLQGTTIDTELWKDTNGVIYEVENQMITVFTKGCYGE